MADVTHDVKEVAREVFFWGILLLSSSPNCHDVQQYNQVPFAKKGYPGSRGRIQRGKKPLENPPENSPENQLEISYTGKSPKIGSLDMS